MSRPTALREPALAATSPFLAHRPEFTDVVGDAPRLERVVATDAHEGPVYVAAEDALYFTTLPRPRPQDAPLVSIKRLALDGERFPLEPERVSVVRGDANGANGMTLGRDGRLVVCEQGSRTRRAAISGFDLATGEVATIVDAWHGLRLNSPNDVVVASDGAVWFTDPGYGHLQGFRPQPLMGDHVYRHDPRTGATSIAAASLDKPNGLALSPGERTLYVTDSGANQERGSFYPERPHHTMAFDVGAHGRLANARRFSTTSPGFPDGIKVDCAGRVYSSAASGVQVFAPGGTQIGEIVLPGAVNFTFGGPRGNVLFITADDAVWAAVLNAKGA